MHYIKVRSLKECYYGYYPKNPSKPVAPARPCRYLALSAAHMDHNRLLFSANIFCSFLVLCAKPKRSNKGWWCSWWCFCRRQWAVSFHAHRLVLCTVRECLQTCSWCSFLNGKHPKERVWVLCEGQQPDRGLRKNLCVAAEPGRLRCVSCPQPPIIPGKVVTSSSLNLSPYFALPSWW